MEIKIQIPNPDDYTGNHENWFKQIKSVFRAAEKVYQNEISNLTKEEYINVWVHFHLDCEKIDEDNGWFNYLHIKVASLD